MRIETPPSAARGDETMTRKQGRAVVLAGVGGVVLMACAPGPAPTLSPQQQSDFVDEMLTTQPSDVGTIPPASTFGAP
jgi:hypothetical protein